MYNDDDDEQTIGDIIYNDCHRRPFRKKHRKYYLGNHFIEKSYLLFDLSIPINVYYNYDEYELCEYYETYSNVCRGHNNKTEIMQLFKVSFPVGRIGQFSLYTVVLKTFWIRILQRVWKKIFKQRRAARATIFAQNEFAVWGNWPRLPSYRGALAIACGVRAKI